MIFLENAISQITPTRTLNLAYIVLDSIFILFLLVLLILKKKYLTCIFSIAGGLLYLLVDYGMFYELAHSREIYILVDNNWILQGKLNTFLILTWMSLSYGITNFAFIWLALKKDKHLKEFTCLIFGWWIACPSLSYFGGSPTIMTLRTTNEYHWIMSLILVIGYGIYILYSLFTNKRLKDLLILNVIGISVQFGWEFALLINGIRPWNDISLRTLLVNSLIETNLGMPYIYGIYILITRRWSEDLQKKKLEILE